MAGSPMIERLRIEARDAEDGLAEMRSFAQRMVDDGTWTESQAEESIYCKIAAWHWRICGCQTYLLSHNLASLFSLTSAPSIDRIPHHSFLLQVPMGFVWKDTDAWMLVGAQHLIIHQRHDRTPWTIAELPIEEDGQLHLCHPEDLLTDDDANPDESAELRLCIRFFANTVAYINEHRAASTCVPASTAHSAAPRLLREPKDVVIDRTFRDAARAAVGARSIAGIRRALAHFVRGHWRNQPVGEGRSRRRLTWVRPHKRGEESIGSVVERISRLRSRDVTP